MNLDFMSVILSICRQLRAWRVPAQPTMASLDHTMIELAEGRHAVAPRTGIARIDENTGDPMPHPSVACVRTPQPCPWRIARHVSAPRGAAPPRANPHERAPRGTPERYGSVFLAMR
ncbi:hypothetical protein ACFPTO_05690 [Paraburkholderia denitrificans]|uniref:Transposase n=1 Tax=Paraburkholderia denitrificans TaxID=694025 RepID=A0ABW0J5P7_9BURK